MGENFLAPLSEDATGNILRICSSRPLAKNWNSNLPFDDAKKLCRGENAVGYEIETASFKIKLRVKIRTIIAYNHAFSVLWKNYRHGGDKAARYAVGDRVDSSRSFESWCERQLKNKD